MTVEPSSLSLGTLYYPRDPVCPVETLLPAVFLALLHSPKLTQQLTHLSGLHQSRAAP